MFHNTKSLHSTVSWFLVGNKPEMHELQMLKSPDGRVLRIMESVSSQWKQMAVALGFSIEKIKSIEKSKQYQTDDASFEIFSCWLEGGHDLKPPTWDTLISCLKQANLLDIADRLCNIEIVSFKECYKIGYNNILFVYIMHLRQCDLYRIRVWVIYTPLLCKNN